MHCIKHCLLRISAWHRHANYYNTAKTINKLVRDCREEAPTRNLEMYECEFSIIHFLRGMLHITEMLNRACEWSALHECTIYENNMQADMETRRLSLSVWAKVTSNISASAWVCTFPSLSLSARRTRNRAEDVIQCLPIKWCPEACLTNAANLCIFRDSSLAALVEVGGRPLYLLYGSADSAAAERGQPWWTAAD